MRLDVDDNRLVEKPRTQYYAWRWAIVIGIPIYIIIGIFLGALVNGDIAGFMLLIIPFGLFSAGWFVFMGKLLWVDCGTRDALKGWLFERKT